MMRLLCFVMLGRKYYSSPPFPTQIVCVRFISSIVIYLTQPTVVHSQSTGTMQVTQNVPTTDSTMGASGGTSLPS